MKKSIFSGLGNIISILGVALTPQELENVEHITAIICMIVGLLITIICSIFIPLVKWWKKAKEDDKIDEEEVKELGNILQEGGEKIKEALNDKKGDKK
ncbi:MAG: hypothetical protein J6T10_16230 [Methanobrevibacter sp.]|nr:hypothetical protein [Methanobrevibacter sp.]